MSRWNLAWFVLLVATVAASVRAAYSAGEVDSAPAAVVSGKRVSGTWRIAEAELKEKARRAGLPFSIEIHELSHLDVARADGPPTLPVGDPGAGFGRQTETTPKLSASGQAPGFTCSFRTPHRTRRNSESGATCGVSTSSSRLGVRRWIG